MTRTRSSIGPGGRRATADFPHRVREPEPFHANTPDDLFRQVRARGHDSAVYKGTLRGTSSEIWIMHEGSSGWKHYPRDPEVVQKEISPDTQHQLLAQLHSIARKHFVEPFGLVVDPVTRMVSGHVMALVKGRPFSLTGGNDDSLETQRAEVRTIEDILTKGVHPVKLAHGDPDPRNIRISGESTPIFIDPDYRDLAAGIDSDKRYVAVYKLVVDGRKPQVTFNATTQD